MIHGDGDNDTNDGDDDERVGNNKIRFLGGNSSSGTKKYRGIKLVVIFGGNTRDGVKIAGGVIGSGDEIGFLNVIEMLPDEKLGSNSMRFKYS
ncbi:hypothetical protein Tco_0693610 [Tanacetum coccineum]